MRHLVPRLDFPEIVIGLVGPIGTPLNQTIDCLKNLFEQCGYNFHDLHVSKLFKSMESLVPPTQTLVEKPLFHRYETYIAYGNQLREFVDDPSLCAALAIQNIIETRLTQSRPERERFTKNVYVVHQFKRPEEIELMRSVYGKVFFQVSVFSRRAARVDHLARKFAEDEGRSNHQEFRFRAEALIDKDENQSREKYGQRLGKIFHNADFIVNKDVQNPNVEKQVERFFELLFSSNTITPNLIEYGMFAAKSAALRTSDLSRQVGAAIFSPDGEIITLGSNEVPKANGGTYWPNQDFDDREHKRKIDSNDKRKKELLRELLEILGIDESSLSKDTLSKLQASSTMDALEYGRIVHAEMSAISDASRLGRELAGSVLYSTTFPCHMCAKHIVASGISKVVYLEPYPKSLASRLHSDSIKIDGEDRGDYNDFPFVEFSHFYGITPRRYREFFERYKRKDDKGELLEYVNGEKIPLIDIKSPFYAQLEEIVLQSLKKALTSTVES